MPFNQSINNNINFFTPTTKEELTQLHWENLDIILISGDTYIDSYYDGTAIIGKTLINAGYKVGIIAQPDVNSPADIMRLGEPNLFWGVSGGCVDSMVANYTASLKKRKSDDLTPGSLNNRRPDRAVIIYANLIRKYFKNTKPIVLGGIEASLRRIAHYDYWSDSIRRSILFDSKADIIVYGEGERTIMELANNLKNRGDYSYQRGICFISSTFPKNYLELPSYEEVKKDKIKFIEMFNLFYKNNDPLNAQGLAQQHSNRYLIQNPPNNYLEGEELDKIYEMKFANKPHPFYQQQGKIKAMDTIKYSVTSHRGCFGECNFCSIAIHQGRRVRSRTETSIYNEVLNLTKNNEFKGIVFDIGGATANMYGMECEIQNKVGSCKNKRCIFPKRCKQMNIEHNKQINLLKRIRSIDAIKKIFIGSGLRFELVLWDKNYGRKYLNDLIQFHISGQLKIAPEHLDAKVLSLMGKPKTNELIDFRNIFNEFNKKLSKKQFLTYYFIAAHPGCDNISMKLLKKYVINELDITPEQVQIFTPTPSTYSTLMYYTELNPFTLEPLFVEKNLKNKTRQKNFLISD